MPVLGRNTACGLEYSDYHAVATAFGGSGWLLDRQPGASDQDVEADIRRTFAAAMTVSGTENQAVLINALIGTTNFREGSLSI